MAISCEFTNSQNFRRLFFLVGLILVCCAKEQSPANKIAVKIWQNHADVIRGGLDGTRNRDEKFVEAIEFFEKTIGLVVRTDGDYIGIIPTKETKSDFKRIEEWFRKNRRRLYWDEQAKVVRVQPPAGLGGAEWWRHELVVIDLVARRRITTDRQVAETRKFFLTLTGIDVLATGEQRHFLRIPRHGVQRPLPQLREWYEANSERLVVDKRTGELQLLGAKKKEEAAISPSTRSRASLTATRSEKSKKGARA